jgi:hypothetical protein
MLALGRRNDEDSDSCDDSFHVYAHSSYSSTTLATAFADHYGMAAMYLRLNGLVPPTAKPKE